jgi:hypothetical protein
MAVMEEGKAFVGSGAKLEHVALPFADRHALITGATGTGKAAREVSRSVSGQIGSVLAGSVGRGRSSEASSAASFAADPKQGAGRWR